METALQTALLIQNYLNFGKSGAPARFLYYENGSWCNFGAEVADHLRVGFSGGMAVVEEAVDGVRCLFDFHRMVQIRLDGGDQRSVAWIDVDGNCFFPKQFIDGNGKSSGAEVENVSVSADEINMESPNCCGNGPVNGVEFGIVSPDIDRDGPSNGAGIGVEGPKMSEKHLEGSPSSFEAESSRWPRVRVLDETENEYLRLKNIFLSGVKESDPGAAVTSIHRVVRPRPLDDARFEAFRKQVAAMKAARGGANVALAWHGESENGVEGILRHGFSEVSMARAYGVGVYLSPVRSANTSAVLSEVDGNGEKHVILCRVILGRSEKVEAGSRQMYPSSENFDSGVDDIKDPKWYVVWAANMNTQILPEYVVSYRPSNSSQGQLRGSSVMRSRQGFSRSAARLISMLGSTLPSPRVHEFQTLCNAYKEGKMAKGCFLMKVRSIVGNEMLVWAIREVRGY